MSVETLKGVSTDELHALYKLAKKHDIAHVIAYALDKNKLIAKGQEGYKPFMYQENLAIYRYENINHELNLICDLLEKEQVSHIPLKGAVIRSLYPEPWMRTSCDIDILVHEDDVDKVIEILKEKLGCRIENKSFYDVSIFTSENVHLEIHFNLAVQNQGGIIEKVLAEVWDSSNLANGCRYKREMTDEMYYYYHLAHMSKHFAGNGCGIRPFIDLWLLDNMSGANNEKRLELARRGDLDKFMLGVQACSKVWLENAPHSAVTLEIENFILQSGVYGTQEIRAVSEQNKKGGKFRYTMSRIFLSFKELKAQYPSLEKHKWLYPFYQVRRWFKLLFCGGVKRSVNELVSIAKRPQEEIKRREKMMKSLGLWN